MSFNAFNSSFGQSESVSPQKPFFTVADKNKSVKLKWLMDEVEIRESFHSQYFKSCYRHLMAYKGRFHRDQKQSDTLDILPKNDMSSNYYSNNTYEFTEILVSKMTQLKPAVDVLPTNDDFDDKGSAKFVKLLLKHLFYVHNLDRLIQKLHRQRVMFGNSYVQVVWNPELGDLNEDGSRTGDVEPKLLKPWNVMPEANNEITWEQSKTVIVRCLKHNDEIIAEYPEAKMVLKGKSKHFNVAKLREETISDHSWVYEFYHKHDAHLVKGQAIKFIDGMILEEGELGYSHGKLPVIRLTDIDVDDQINGMSRYEQTLQMQKTHNNLSKTIIKNEFLAGMPKWMMPKGAAKVEALSPGRTIVQFQGAIEPKLVQMNPTSPTTLNIRQQIELEHERKFGIHQISRGVEVKSNVSALSLNFLKEEENNRASTDISKHNQFIVDLAKMLMAVAGDYYDSENPRAIRITGKNNKHLIKYFDAAHLNKSYDVRIENANAFADSLASKKDQVIQTLQYLPPEMIQQVLPPARIVELLEFGHVEKMNSLITESINSAESQVEDILEGNEVAEIQEYEVTTEALDAYYKSLQKRSFKEEVPPERRIALIEHIKSAEMIAEKKMKKNTLFRNKLAGMEMFPMFWSLSEPVILPLPPEEEQGE